jgi:hypothetical protein
VVIPIAFGCRTPAGVAEGVVRGQGKVRRRPR